MPIILSQDGRYFYLNPGTTYTSWTSNNTTPTSMWYDPETGVYSQWENTALTTPTGWYPAVITVPNEIGVNWIPWMGTVGAEDNLVRPESLHRPTVARPHVRASDMQKRVQRADAEARARELLLSMLTERQRDRFERHGWFEVVGKSGKVYRITGAGYAGNVRELSEGREHRLCCHLAGSFPLGDHLLAQKMMLEGDEDEFLRLANRS